MAVAAIAACSPILAREALAFKLFGMSFFESDEPTEQIIDPVNYTVTLDTGDADSDLSKALTGSSMLVSGKDKPVSGDLGVVIRARDDRDRLLATLYEHARYGGVVTVTVNGTDIDALAPNPTFPRSRPVAVVVRVKPGPVFTLGKVQLLGDAARLSPAAYGLTRGGDAGSLNIIKAGDKMVADFKSEGRPLAKVVTRSVIADHDTHTVDLTLRIDSGPVAPIGNVAVKGQQSVDPDFIRRYSLLNEGKPYSPEALKKASDRLRRLGVFSSVTIRPADSLAPNGTIPMTIEVSEGKQRYLGVGAQYSTIDGFGIQGYWGHRNLFGQAESLRIEGSIGRLLESSSLGSLDYAAGIIYSKPGAFFPSATFNASLKAKTEHPDSYDAKTATANANLAYEITDYDTVVGGGQVEYEDSTDALGHHKYLTVSIPLSYLRDTRDNKLDPTEGYRATVNLNPSYETMNGTFFSSLEASLSGYQAFGSRDNVVFAGKVALGSLLGADNLVDIPATRRFYAGGGGSVRGFGYQQITVYDAFGDAIGGRSYVTASFEARIKITDTIGVVPFVDAGSVTDTAFPDFSDFRVGTGIGFRYATPFGPIRLDFAVPLNKYPNGSDFGVYAGIGQAF